MSIDNLTCAEMQILLTELQKGIKNETNIEIDSMVIRNMLNTAYDLIEIKKLKKISRKDINLVLSKEETIDEVQNEKKFQIFFNNPMLLKEENNKTLKFLLKYFTIDKLEKVFQCESGIFVTYRASSEVSENNAEDEEELNEIKEVILEGYWINITLLDYLDRDNTYYTIRQYIPSTELVIYEINRSLAKRKPKGK